MSAFIVGKEHINAMITAGLSVRYKPLRWFHDGKWHELTFDTADQVGQMLLDENVKSVSYLYSEDDITNLPGKTDAEWLIPFKYHPIAGDQMPALWAIKITGCYEYQSCEHPEWKDSEAKAFCEALKEAKLCSIDGYDDAPWEWTRPMKTSDAIRLI